MNRTICIEGTLGLILSLVLAGCGGDSKADPKDAAPPPAVVEHEEDVSGVKVDRPERVKLATAEK